MGNLINIILLFIMATTFKFKSLETTDTFTLRSLSDRTKAVTFSLSSISSGQVRVLTIPNKSGTIALLDDITGGDTVSIDATAADVLTATSGAISADDGGTIDSADPFIKWDDTAGKLVYANPLSRPAGAFYVGLAPTTTALGTDAVNIQSTRTAATQVASGTRSVAIGYNSTCSGSYSQALGERASCTGVASIAIGSSASCTANDAVAIGGGAVCGGISGTAVGRAVRANVQGSVAVGHAIQANGVNSVVIGSQGLDVATLRGQFSVRPFNAIYWGGQTTDATATVLDLDGTATNRFTIAANTALIADIFLIARSTDNTKFLSARRSVAIYRDNANVTALIGDVQTLGNDQSVGSPAWSISLTSDDVNEALQLEVTGAIGDTVNWRATAFYRVV